MRNIRIELEAKQDMVEAISYYDQHKPGLGTEFLDALKDLLRRIADNPHLYASFRRQTRKAVMTRFPYYIVYRFDAESVIVAAVFYGSTGKTQHKYPIEASG